MQARGFVKLCIILEICCEYITYGNISVKNEYELKQPKVIPDTEVFHVKLGKEQ